MLDWTNCRVNHDLKGNVISWPPEEAPDHIQKSEITLDKFCEDKEVEGLHILPLKLEFYDGVMACEQGSSLDYQKDNFCPSLMILFHI